MTWENLFLPQKFGMYKGRGQELGDAGDAGAVVYNEEGAVVGLVSRGLKPRNWTAEAYPFVVVTLIEPVFADIKRFTGVEDINVWRG